MGIKEVVDDLISEQSVATGQRVDPEKVDLKRHREWLERAKIDALRRALHSWKCPKIMEELNSECLGGNGRMRMVEIPSSALQPLIEGSRVIMFLDWGKDNDKFIAAGANFGNVGAQLTVSGSGVIKPDDLDYGHLEDIFAQAFLKPGSYKRDFGVLMGVNVKDQGDDLESS